MDSNSATASEAPAMSCSANYSLGLDARARTAAQELLDKHEIQEVLATYVRAADRCDRALLDAVFHEEAIDVHFREAHPAREFIGGALDLLKTTGPTAHYFCFPLVNVVGDVAYSELYEISVHRIQAADGHYESIFGGRVYDRFERRRGVWKVAHREVIYDWNRDIPTFETWNRGAFGAAIAREGRQDATDPLYGFLSTQTRSIAMTAQPPPSFEQRVQTALDKQEIYELLATYARAVDRCDEELMLSVYHPDSIDVRMGKRYTSREFVRFVIPLLSKLGNSAHYFSYPLIEVHGDVAWSECYVMVFHRMHDESGDYDSIWGERVLDRYERRNGVWKVAYRQSVCDWNRDVPSAETWNRGVFGSGIRSEAVKGRGDPVYAFLASQQGART
jgi:ketosteroid isomerase-like protein